MSAPALLSVQNVSVNYGAVQALKNVDLEIFEGEIVTLIGANGAGKSTMMMCACGQPKPTSGQILFDGVNLANLPTHDIMKLGIAQSPEGRRIFARMSVLENLQMGAALNPNADFETNLALAYELFPILKSRQEQRGGTLSGGEQQMLAIARALMSEPRLLMLDEPSLGLAPLIVKHIFEVLKHLNEAKGLTIFLVEQNAYHALKLAHRGYVLVNGCVSMSGLGQELLSNHAVRAAYLEGAI